MVNLDITYCSSAGCQKRKQCAREDEKVWEFFDANPDMTKPISVASLLPTEGECEHFEEVKND